RDEGGEGLLGDSVGEGLVVRRDGPQFWVSAEGREVRCSLRGRLRLEQSRVTSMIVVGDRVMIRSLPDGSGTIERVHPRRSELVRPGFGGLAHVMAANVDQLVVVQAARDPAFKRRLVERFLATARHGGMGAVVV